MKTIFLIYIFLTFGLMSCKGKDVVISGRIIEDCTGNTPYANQEVHLKSIKRKGSRSKKSDINEVILTNSSGEFVYKYNTKDYSGEKVFIENLFGKANYDGYGDGIQFGDSVSLGTLSLNSDLSIRFVLNVMNSYSNQDTLIVRDPFGSSIDDYLKIAGPFTNNTVISSGVLEGLDIRLKNNKVQLYYGVDYTPRIKLANNSFVYLYPEQIEEASNCQSNDVDYIIPIE